MKEIHVADPKDIKKSVEETVDQILAGEKSSEVSKAMPASTPANGGEDKIRSGSPMTEAAAKVGKSDSEEEEKDEEEDEKEDEAKKAMSDKEKDEADKAAQKKAEALAEHEKKEIKDRKMKKSLEELSQHLDAEELELVKTWREEEEKEAQLAKSAAASPAVPSMSQIEEVLKKAVAQAVTESTADLRKALVEKETLIKSLNDKIEKVASQPAYDRRSISTLETLEKSGASDSTELKKSQVLDKMLELQTAGKGVTSHHIAEFEATNNISDAAVRGLVFRELKLN